jgi:branched-chain amino acid transport system permease protein
MNTFIQLTTSGLALGAVYALIALGFVAIYKASKVFNFAHGDLLTLGAFLMVSLCQSGLHWALALPAAMLGTGLVGMGIERVVLRPLLGRPVFVTIILTIFVGYLLRIAIELIWGSNPYGMPTPWETTAAFDVGGVKLMLNALMAVLATAIALTAYFLLMRYSRIGVAMRAAASDQEAALTLGIPVGRTLGVTWMIAGMLAALAGIFLGMFPRQVEVNLAYVALAAFPAVLVGGLESALGAVIAGFALGVLQLWAQGYVNPLLGSFGHNFHTVFPYVIMILFLMVRPYGLFGEKEVKRV